MATTLRNTIQKYFKTLKTQGFGRTYDLNQEKSLEEATTFVENLYLKLREELENDSHPTKEAIEAARYFNTQTKASFAYARNNRVEIIVSPIRAKRIANELGPVDED